MILCGDGFLCVFTLQNKIFNYGVHLETYDIILYNFNDGERHAKKFKEGILHLMYNDEKHGLPNVRLVVDGRIIRVKIYQKLCHDILYVIQRQMLDYMPILMRMMYTELRQLQDLMMRWKNMTEEMRHSRCTKIMI